MSSMVKNAKSQVKIYCRLDAESSTPLNPQPMQTTHNHWTTQQAANCLRGQDE